LFTNVVVTTNLLITASNSAGLFFSQSELSFATNHILIVEPIICGATAGGTTTNAPGLYQGLGKLQFVRTTFDSLLGQFFQPVTNTYTMEMVSNSKLVNQTFQRVVTAPDFLISAGDLASGPGDGPPPVVSTYARNINFDQANVPPGLAGPGTIDTATTISFNKSGSAFFNTVGGNELTEIQSYVWGSFDGSTNDPVAYPNGTSLANLANQVLVQITPATLPNGTNGVVYPATTFLAVGGAFTPPFTWSLPSGGLPSGLTLSSGGTISGTPTQSGTFDFTLQLTDVVSRTVQWNYTLIIQ
jgi:cyclophilin family peptidyl-prolyl cis-trans isomerase